MSKQQYSCQLYITTNINVRIGKFYSISDLKSYDLMLALNILLLF